jgi:tetrapyrrole methylase family protein/MazG family protein
MNFEQIFLIAQKMNLDYKFGLKIVTGNDLVSRHSLLHSPDENAIYDFSEQEIPFSFISDLAILVYQPDYRMFIVEINENTLIFHEERLKNLTKELSVFKNGYVFFPADLQSLSFLPFIELIAHLRSPEGCPWDRKQTHQTLRTNLLEETYEVLEAIDNGDLQSLSEELGDLLLQIVLHAQIANEAGNFNIYQVIRGIHNKLVSRHPHVFSDWEAKDSTTVIRNWEVLKSQEREQKGQNPKKGLLDSVPRNLPALSLAQKYQERAARVGFDWPDIYPVIEKIEEEIVELKEASDALSRERELGDLLFAMVNLIRWYGLDAESVLRQMNKRFLKRFSFIEEKAALQGRRMNDLTLEEMDLIWEQAKAIEAIAAQNEQ